MKVIYIIGEPGVGKTTLMRAVGEKLGYPVVESDKPVPHLTYPGNVIQLGRDRIDFAGTDALALNIQPRAEAFLRTKPAAYVFAEGDRLGNRSFFMKVGSFADLRVVWLIDRGGIAAKRRAMREHALGKTQDAAWVRGRITKVVGLADLVNLRIPADLPLNEQVALVREELKR